MGHPEVSSQPASNYSLFQFFFPNKVLESKIVENICNFDKTETHKISFSIFAVRNIQSAHFLGRVFQGAREIMINDFPY